MVSGQIKLYKRHETGCPSKDLGRYFIGCDCPFWCAPGNGSRYSLGTSSVSEALSLLRDDRPERDPELRRDAMRAVHAAGIDGRFVYVIKPENLDTVKIGVAVDVDQRLSALQVSHSDRLTVVRVLNGGFPLERALHDIFTDYRLEGEWFTLCGPIAKWIVDTAAFDARHPR